MRLNTIFSSRNALLANSSYLTYLQFKLTRFAFKEKTFYFVYANNIDKSMLLD